MPPFFSCPAVPAILALADGTIFKGISIGAAGHTTGEVVFNTSMTGYQEILTDPSYSRQIVTLTYPHIGNYGINTEDVEASKVHAAGLIIRDLTLIHSNFRSSQSLTDYLKAAKLDKSLDEASLTLRANRPSSPTLSSSRKKPFIASKVAVTSSDLPLERVLLPRGGLCATVR